MKLFDLIRSDPRRFAMEAMRIQVSFHRDLRPNVSVASRIATGLIFQALLEKEEGEEENSAFSIFPMVEAIISSTLLLLNEMPKEEWLSERTKTVMSAFGDNLDLPSLVHDFIDEPAKEVAKSILNTHDTKFTKEERNSLAKATMPMSYADPAVILVVPMDYRTSPVLQHLTQGAKQMNPGTRPIDLVVPILATISEISPNEVTRMLRGETEDLKRIDPPESYLCRSVVGLEWLLTCYFQFRLAWEFSARNPEPDDALSDVDIYFTPEAEGFAEKIEKFAAYVLTSEVPKAVNKTLQECPEASAVLGRCVLIDEINRIGDSKELRQ